MRSKEEVEFARSRINKAIAVAGQTDGEDMLMLDLFAWFLGEPSDFQAVMVSMRQVDAMAKAANNGAAR